MSATPPPNNVHYLMPPVVTGITIENFKGIKKVELNPIRPVNVLIGRNNCGKSSVLACVGAFARHLAVEQFNSEHPAGMSRERLDNSLPREFFRNSAQGEDYQEISVRIHLRLSREDREAILVGSAKQWNQRFTSPLLSETFARSLLDTSFLSTMYFHFNAVKPKSGFALKKVSTEYSDRYLDRLVVPLAKGQSQDLHVNDPIRLLESGHGNIDPNARVQEFAGFHAAHQFEVEFRRIWFDPAYRAICDFFSSCFLMSPFRHGKETESPQLCADLSPSGDNLVQFMHNLALNRHDVFQGIADFVKAVLPEVGRLHPRFTGDEQNLLELAYEWPDRGSVNLVNMGGGVEQLLVLGSLLLHQKPTCILWEEPESHLHPGAQDCLLGQVLKLLGGSRLFLTTHSPVFLRDNDNIAVHAIENRDGKNAEGRTLTSNDLITAALLIGSRPGHLAQADIVLYVEGKHGTAVVEEWLAKWPERERVLRHLQLVVQSSNVEEAGTEDFDMHSLTKVTPHMIVFADNDCDPGQTKPKKPRQLLKEKCEEQGIPCIITKNRQIEDYFTEEAVCAGLPSNLRRNWQYDSQKPIGQTWCPGWKKYNRRIARAMQWEDVSRHPDLMRIFEEVEKCARRLMPPESEQPGFPPSRE